MSEEKIKENLAGKKILIIEDDESLPKRLANEFGRYGAKAEVKHCVESGLEELKQNGLNYHLIVVDVMLPQTKEAFQQIQHWIKEITEYNEVFIQEDEAESNNVEFNKIVENAKHRRSVLLEKITKEINPRGGIEMVKDWLDWLKNNRDDEGEKIERPPILYLTAAGNVEIIMDGKEVAGAKDVEWLVKPVSGLKLMHTAAELLE